MKIKSIIKCISAFVLSTSILFINPVSSVASEDLGKYGMLPIYGMDMNDGTYDIQVKCNALNFQITSSKLTVKNGLLTVFLTIDNGAYSKLFLGTVNEVEEASNNSFIEAKENDSSVKGFTLPISSLDTTFAVAAYCKPAMEWEACSMLFDATSLPEEALNLNLPDYDAIEKAMSGVNIDSSKTNSLLAMEPVEAMDIDLTDGEYAIEAELAGGSGKAAIVSPTYLYVKEGKAYARIQWSSSNYDYMLVGTEKYLNTAEEGMDSVFEIPIAYMDAPMMVVGNTHAMGTPHEVQYSITFYQDSIGPVSQMPQEAAKRVIIVAFLIIILGGILNHYLHKKRRA